MNKFTSVAVLLLLVTQISFSSDYDKRIDTKNVIFYIDLTEVLKYCTTNQLLKHMKYSKVFNFENTYSVI